MVVECNVNINSNDLGIIVEAYDKVLLAVFKQVISNNPDYHDTMGWLNEEWK